MIAGLSRSKRNQISSARPVIATLSLIAILAGTIEVVTAQPQSAQNCSTNPTHFEPPSSELLTAEERNAVEQWLALQKIPADCQASSDILEQRKCTDTRYWSVLLNKQNARYKVNIRPLAMSGVNTEIITPIEGIARPNLDRVLINLHGGGFVFGARYEGQAESIPISATGRIKVVSVDYRMAPEHRFPSASEDVVAVYRTLLNEYRPENIGIYGCSAGAVLTAEAVAWIQKEKLPRPGAVGMFCAAAGFWTDGDSGAWIRSLLTDPAMQKTIVKHKPFIVAEASSYFHGADLNDPLVFPIHSKEVMAQFPPSLLVSATRDIGLSSVVHTHALLLELGVKAELHVWEGLGHGFFVDPDIPQSRQFYSVTAKFFDENLGREPRASDNK